MGSDRARPATVEEVDESGMTVRGSRRSASTKEKPKVHRESRSGKSSRRPPLDEPTSNAIQHLELMNREKEMKLERRVSTSGKSSPRKPTRPPSSHENRAYSAISIPRASGRDDQSYFGIQPATSATSQPISLAHRPRPLPQSSQTYPRPQSYHATQSSYGPGPPLSASAYYQQPPSMTAPSYPPPSPSYFSNVRYATPLQPVQQQADYYGNQALVSRPLASRFDMVRSANPTFDPISRAASAFGTRDIQSRISPSEYDDDGYNSASESLTIRRARRGSILRGPPLTKAEEDALSMPPPSSHRPGILRRTTDYPIEAPDPSDYARSEYPEPPRPRRPSASRQSVSYDFGTESGRVRVEAANSSRRRESWYEQPESSVSSGYEAQMHQATSYQEDVAGGPTAPLTAEMLRKQQKREVGSSRSTKSSASRDESDIRKSVTTRTTRSGSGNDDENMTIKVTGQARVMVGSTQIDCTEGGAIEIKREKSQRMGSERSESVYGGNRRIEDRPGRSERPSGGRSRMSSTTRKSHARTSREQYPPNPDYF